MNNPVQIILNSNNFVNNVTPLPGGSNKDFYSGRDEEFVKHKTLLDSSISQILETQKFSDEEIIYTNVTLQDNGWAKTHRPTAKIFTENNSVSIMGGNNLGEIIVGLTLDNLQKIRKLVNEAPDINEIVEKDGKLQPKITSLRSEVGVIKEIRLYDQVDKRTFSTNQAIEWLINSTTGHSYYIETFINNNHKTTKEVSSLQNCLNKVRKIYPNLEISYLNESWLETILIIIKFSNLDDLIDSKRHDELLKVLDHSSIVRAIHLPPILQTTHTFENTSSQTSIPLPEQGKNYPVVGVIDTGVSLNNSLNHWLTGGIDFLDKNEQDLSHGTFIAGLLAASKHLNSEQLLDEHDCKIYDLDLFPTSGDFEDYYPKGFIDLLKQLEDFIPIAKEHNVRIFNMSLNLLTCVEDNRYSIFANIIDNISKKHDVIFVISAGNLSSINVRNEWPHKEIDALKMLAEYRFQGQDRVYQPAESIYSVSVGAIDPERTSNHLRPSQYTRRGPGVSFSHKPDVVHIGGAYTPPHNLSSIDPMGNLTHGCGTSYAAPLVAKTLANLNHAIESTAKTETLRALLFHHCNRPKWSKSSKMKLVGNDFMGFGIPSNSASSLMTSDHEITMVFESKISKNQELNFEFSWPQSLINDKGGIIGNLKITLVYSPGINRLNGAEFVLHTLDVWLRQQTNEVNAVTGEPIFSNILNTSNSNKQAPILEKERVKHGSKWWPVRSFNQTFKGKGNSSRCKLVVEPLARAGYEITEPVPFTVILTISDPSKENDIFNEVRAHLNASGIAIADIRSNLQSRLRP
ncbi:MULTISPECIES: S8 family peptidase [Acinetobacter]|uniref:S8 family peptidase n=1 Tax=Acinetobacter TaxID=469 RepID=UPI00076126B9|nr:MULTISPECIES: S8 family peptidase [Acinetobacter]ODL96780.1 hypothetical protein AXH23_03795 [Acinetobacter pittii]